VSRGVSAIVGSVDQESHAVDSSDPLLHHWVATRKLLFESGTAASDISLELVEEPTPFVPILKCSRMLVGNVTVS